MENMTLKRAFPPSYTGDPDITAYAVGHGLAVHRNVSGRLWVVSHIKSGRSVAVGFPTRKAAIAFAGEPAVRRAVNEAAKAIVEGVDSKLMSKKKFVEALAAHGGQYYSPGTDLD